ncbi:MAG: OmpA family protein [Pseudorhodobacter sp.]|nr:OmpA family protein [Pseudorhodobacter sp.]
MKRLLTTTTALSMALSPLAPLPLLAQTTVTVDGQVVICLPDADTACPEGATCVIAPETPCDADTPAVTDKAAREAEKAAREAQKKAAAAERAAEKATAAADKAAATAAEQAVAADEAAAAATAAEQAVADAAAADVAAAAEQAAVAAQAAADAVAAEEAAVAAAAQAAADAAAAAALAAADAAAAEEAAAAAQAAADAAAAAQAAADAAAAEQAAVAAQAAADAAAAEEAAAAADAGADAVAAEEAAVAAQAAADAAAAEEAAAAADAGAAEEAAAAALAAAQAATAAAADQAAADAAAAQAAAAAADSAQPAILPILDTAEGLDAPTQEAVSSLLDILSGTSETETSPVAVAAAAIATAAAAEAGATVTVVTEADSRSSSEDFVARSTDEAQAAATAAETTEPAVVKKRKGMTDLEKFGLVVLGGLVVGAILNNGDKVVSNTGDRVVVQRDDGQYVVLKDDDTLLRRPGSTVRTENFTDGSSRTIVERDDGSRIITIRDASGRVLRRSRIDVDGRESLLIDDLVPVERIDVASLPKPKPSPMDFGTQDEAAALRAALLAVEAGDIGRRFSLRQIRDYREVRALAPTINVDNVTFETGSAAIRVTEATKLARLGRLIADLIAANPAEMFLIEGHTDAVGSAASNLALSDRRAESLALALTEYYGVPPENLVVQGYGEAELRIETQGAEVRNRRAAVRMISPLLHRMAAN